ncbi:MAG: hypothetical protein LBM25_06660 [Bacteroidales bacterium]|jgi:hypothetical protein|nr:hypothetical protein [Bacteroidales bacterium]
MERKGRRICKKNLIEVGENLEKIIKSHRDFGEDLGKFGEDSGKIGENLKEIPQGKAAGKILKNTRKILAKTLL